MIALFSPGKYYSLERGWKRCRLSSAETGSVLPLGLVNKMCNDDYKIIVIAACVPTGLGKQDMNVISPDYTSYLFFVKLIYDGVKNC